MLNDAIFHLCLPRLSVGNMENSGFENPTTRCTLNLPTNRIIFLPQQPEAKYAFVPNEHDKAGVERSEKLKPISTGALLWLPCLLDFLR